MGTESGQEFRFYTKLDQTILLGRKASNVPGLLEGIKTVPESSIYYHTHKFLQQHHYLSPEPPNDFAYWITNVLNEPTLGEQLSSIDIIQFHTIEDLRKTFVDTIESFLQTANRTVESPAGEQFYFMGSQTFVFRTSHVARTLPEFVECLNRVTIHSLYLHVFDSRLRLEHEENDFSVWFRKIGHGKLADAVKKLDPYTQTLDGLRRNIIQLAKRYAED
jgi:hypothetical protein